MQRGGSQGSSQGTAWSHLFNSDSYSGSVMWALVRGQATEPWHSEGAGWRARAVVFPPVLLWTSGMGRPRGGTRAPAGGQTEREPLVWTERSWRMEPQACKRFPLLDPAECCQAWGRERSTGPKATLQGESILFPLGAPLARFLTTRSLCFFLCESPTLTSLPAILGAV